MLTYDLFVLLLQQVIVSIHFYNYVYVCIFKDFRSVMISYVGLSYITKFLTNHLIGLLLFKV